MAEKGYKPSFSDSKTTFYTTRHCCQKWKNKTKQLLLPKHLPFSAISCSPGKHCNPTLSFPPETQRSEFRAATTETVSEWAGLYSWKAVAWILSSIIASGLLKRGWRMRGPMVCECTVSKGKKSVSRSSNSGQMEKKDRKGDPLTLPAQRCSEWLNLTKGNPEAKKPGILTHSRDYSQGVGPLSVWV